MPNIVEWKEYLFVMVPELATDFDLPEQDFESVLQFKIMSWHTETLPPGSYQIIGKGDRVSMYGWAEIVEAVRLPLLVCYKDYLSDDQHILSSPTESGLSLLRSLKMEPGTTLVLKKQTKFK